MSVWNKVSDRLPEQKEGEEQQFWVADADDCVYMACYSAMDFEYTSQTTEFKWYQWENETQGDPPGEILYWMEYEPPRHPDLPTRENL